MDQSYKQIEIKEPSVALVQELQKDVYAAWQMDTERKLKEAGLRSYVHTFRSTRERFYSKDRDDDEQDAWNDGYEDATQMILATLPPSFKSLVLPIIKEAAGEARDLTTLLASIHTAISEIRSLAVSTSLLLFNGADLRLPCRLLDRS
jgi:hypothetical protein